MNQSSTKRNKNDEIKKMKNSSILKNSTELFNDRHD
jgi:hypothetical protein